MTHRQLLLAALLLSIGSLSALAQVTATKNPPTKPPAKALSPSKRAEKSAEKQSGLNKSEAESLLLHKGFIWLNDLHAEPSSIWVWQANATENGRQVRVGIDFRGRVLVISPTASSPCTLPGVSSGVSGLGAGATLSTSSACARR
jgi:hypothetical protein